MQACHWVKPQACWAVACNEVYIFYHVYILMVNNDFIYKTMEEMKPFPKLAHLHGCRHAGCRFSDHRLCDQWREVPRSILIYSFPRLESVLLLLFFRFFWRLCVCGKCLSRFFLHLLRCHDSTRLENTAVICSVGTKCQLKSNILWI